MTTTLKVEKPDAIEMTLTMTMPLGHWKKLKNQLANNFPAWDLSTAITEMVNKAETHFRCDVKEGGE